MGVVIHDFGTGVLWQWLAPTGTSATLPTLLSLQHSIADSQSL